MKKYFIKRFVIFTLIFFILYLINLQDKNLGSVFKIIGISLLSGGCLGGLMVLLKITFGKMGQKRNQ